MDSKTIRAFGCEIEKMATVGDVFATHIPKVRTALRAILRTPAGSATSKFTKKYFPTFRRKIVSKEVANIPKTIGEGVKNTLAVGTAGTAAIGGYAMYRGMKGPAPLDMSGY